MRNSYAAICIVTCCPTLSLHGALPIEASKKAVLLIPVHMLAGVEIGLVAVARRGPEREPARERVRQPAPHIAADATVVVVADPPRDHRLEVLGRFARGDIDRADRDRKSTRLNSSH